MTGERILVIDNSVQTREFLQDFLTSNHYRVLTTKDGAKGLEMILQDSPDLVILDMQMPRLSGIQVMEKLKAKNIEIPIIFTTVHGSEELAVTALRLGALDYVPKPFEPLYMLEAVERAIQRGAWRKTQVQQANQALQRQLQELNALYTIGKSVTSLLDTEQVLCRIVQAATFMTRAEEGALALIDSEENQFVLRATKIAAENKAHATHIIIEDELCQRVAKVNKPLCLSGEALQRVSPNHPARALLCVPLNLPGRGVIGVLSVMNKLGNQELCERDMFLLSAIGDYAAIALDNAALFAKLETEKSKLEALLRETGAAVIVVDLKDHIQLCNQAARDAFELHSVQVDGRPLQTVVKHQELLDLFADPSIADQVLQRDVSLRNDRTLSAHISAIRNVGRIAIMQDITHLKELDRIKSEFVSTVSHDLRTPLTTIQGYIDLLFRVGPLNEQQQEFISRIQNSLSSVTDLIGDLLDVGRIEAGLDLEMIKTNLEPVITEAVAELRPEAESKGQKLHLEIPARLSPLIGNARRLRQVITNLIGNAIKYTSNYGKIIVTVVEGEKHFMITVVDNGIGIPLKDQPYVFDKFYRADTPEARKIKGTGLGLSIVKSVVEKHGGRVWVDSIPGEGSTFTVLLPKNAKTINRSR